MFMNLLLPPIITIYLLICSPFLVLLKLVSHVKRYIFIENLAGKVAIIIGASSGIGEQLAYEYANKGARLALVAIREDCLQAVASKARELGAPDVVTISADVCKVEDCERFVQQTVDSFGKLDHLVNNAGIAHTSLFQMYKDISEAKPVMDINLLGSIYSTYFAIPHLRKSKGRIIVLNSVVSQIPIPYSSIYNASKAALLSLYESLRSEFGNDIGVTIVSRGLSWTNMMKGDLQQKALQFEQFESVEVCAKGILKSACRGDMYLTTPSWFSSLFVVEFLYPELMHWIRLFFFNRCKEYSRKI